MDDVVFGLEDVKEVYKRMEEQKYFSKIVIKIEEQYLGIYRVVI